MLGRTDEGMRNPRMIRWRGAETVAVQRFGEDATNLATGVGQPFNTIRTPGTEHGMRLATRDG
ncbi:hypothetical protein [Virgisporangium aliadipatigenens]|uniref:hypothetical protein n=1 Tax=Virgisporangium aliadipatigenens TaxID=741659 RepID=UPI001941E266|nr:hypothetical protein [Virgisporangium aliadipatigenens]